MRGRTSTQPAYAHSCRMRSLSLLTASGCATVLVLGNVSGRLLNPYAIAASSIMSHSCRMSGRVGGMATSSVSASPGESSVRNDMRSRRSLTCGAERFSPVHELMYEACACVCREERSGEITTLPSG
jgi:hypothetical protein